MNMVVSEFEGKLYITLTGIKLYMYNGLPCRPSSLLCLEICLVDQVSVLGIEVNGALVVGARTSPRRVG